MLAGLCLRPLSPLLLQCTSDLSLSARHPSSEVVEAASSPGSNDGAGVASGDGRDDLAQGLGAEGGLNVDIGLSWDLLVDVFLSRDLLVHIGHHLGGSHGAGDHSEEDLTEGGQVIL